MIDDLKQLLCQADRVAANAASCDTDRLLTAALQRRKQTARRRTGVALAAIGIVSAGIFVTSQRQNSIIWKTDAVADRDETGPSHRSLDPAVRQAHVDELRREVERLDREADMQLRVVRQVQADRARVAWIGPAEFQASGGELVRLEAARSGALSWKYATLMEDQLHDIAVIRREYERVAQRFPGTEWAELAAVSLRRLSEKPRERGSL